MSKSPSRSDKRNPLLPVNRREFMQTMQCLGLGAVMLPQIPPLGKSPSVHALMGRVVHVHDEAATSWDFGSTWYGWSVDQSAVDTMVNDGLLKLTGASTVVKAWERLIPKFELGQKIAIKVNFNNYYAGGPDPDADINAVIEPVNSLIGTLIQFGFDARDISVYDMTNGFHDGGMPPNSFISRCLYPGVNFVCYVGNPDPYSATEKVHFNCPPPPKPQISDRPICNVLVDSDYLINMPIIKAHPYGFVTLGFKHHYGSLNRCDYLHSYLPADPDYVSYYSTLVDIYKNPHFGAKTVLTVGDGLFGNWKSVSGKPLKWLSFGNGAPNSLFFSTDPVAVDSVMTDFIDIERQQQGYGALQNSTRDYLVLAEKAHLGIFDTGDPFQMPLGSGYGRLFYIYVG